MTKASNYCSENCLYQESLSTVGFQKLPGFSHKVRNTYIYNGNLRALEQLLSLTEGMLSALCRS